MQDTDDSEVRVLKNIVHDPHQVRQNLFPRVKSRHEKWNVTRGLVVRYDQRLLV